LGRELVLGKCSAEAWRRYTLRNENTLGPSTHAMVCSKLLNMINPSRNISWHYTHNMRRHTWRWVLNRHEPIKVEQVPHRVLRDRSRRLRPWLPFNGRSKIACPNRTTGSLRMLFLVSLVSTLDFIDLPSVSLFYAKQRMACRPGSVVCRHTQSATD
jgi:hypothetical protein